MKLTRLVTKNFKKLGQFECEFTSGLNVISGDNAAGKSTLLQAVEVCLYGPSVVPGKTDSIPTWGAKSWSIKLSFEIDGAAYEVERSKSTAKLVQVEGGNHGDSLLANGQTPVTQKISELLGLTGKDYNLFMQSKQGETTGLLTFGATDLNRKVEEFAGISEIDRIQGLAQERYRTATAEAKALEQRVQGTDIADLKARLDYLELERDQAKFEISVVLDKLEKLGDEPEPYTGPSPTSIQQGISRRQRADAAIEACGRELNAAGARYEEAQGYEIERADVTALKSAAGKARNEVGNALRDHREMLNLRDEWKMYLNIVAEEEGKYSQAKIEQLKDQLSTQQNAHEVQEELASRKRADAAILEERAARKVEQADSGVCSSCGTVLDHEHDPDSLRAEAKDLEEQAENFRREARTAALCGREKATEIKRIEREISTCVDGMRNVEQAESALEALAKENECDFAEVEEAVEQWVSEITAAQQRLADATAALNRADKVNEEADRKAAAIERARKALSQAQEAFEEAKTQREALGPMPEPGAVEKAEAASEAAAKAISEYREARGELNLSAAELDTRFMVAESNIENCKDQLNRAQEDEQKMMDQLSSADLAQRLVKFLRERRVSYLKEIWDVILGVASRQVSRASGGMVTRVIYDNGSFLYEEDGILAPVTSASGAQKAHIGVALRVGLSRALYGRDALLIFDEPTESMREHHASGLAASLAGVASQCLLITHREQDQDLAANVIEVG